MRNVRIRSIGWRTFNKTSVLGGHYGKVNLHQDVVFGLNKIRSFTTHGRNELGFSLEEFMFIIIAAIIQIVSK